MEGSMLMTRRGILERLRGDHRRLRTKARLLESVSALGPNAWFGVRELCLEMATRLRQHSQREHRLVTYGWARHPSEVCGGAAIIHAKEMLSLHVIATTVLTDYRPSYHQLELTCGEAAAQMRETMTRQERELFPMLERWLEEPEPSGIMEDPPPASRLADLMTVNRLLQQYPEAREVLERWHVNLLFEGYDLLDEVVWRRGVDGRELLRQLETLVARHNVEQESAQQTWEGFGTDASIHENMAVGGGDSLGRHGADGGGSSRGGT